VREEDYRNKKRVGEKWKEDEREHASELKKDP